MPGQGPTNTEITAATQPLVVDHQLALGEFVEVALRLARAVDGWHQAHGPHGALCPGVFRVPVAGAPIHLARATGAPAAPMYAAPEQTGRLERGVDERTDLYALGVLFYQLVGGEPPLPATDTARWWGSHPRLAPRPLAELVGGLPPSLGEIIEMLLAESPNDRYQTARGLVVDLEHCRNALAAGTAATPLLLRMRDVPRRLVVSGRTYGRDRQLGRLRAVYDRIAAGGPAELVTVTADTGFGKWTAVAEFADTMVAYGAVTLRATCGRDENIPYAAVTRLLTDLAGQLADTPAEHRTRIADAVGACGATLVELVPALGAVLGDLPPSPAGPVESARNRMHLAVRRLLGAMGTPEHPPIIAIGNVGWADQATVDLLRYVLGGRNAPSVLAVVTYRTGDVNAEHPCHALVTDDRLRIASMQLRPLPDSALTDLLADALGSGKTDSSRLSRTIAARTRSNPLLVGHFLHDLADRDLITYRAEGATWGWHERLIDSEPDVTGIAALVGSRLARFPTRTRELLEIAAVLGPRFDAGTLATAAHHARLADRTAADGGRVPRSRGAARPDAVTAVTTALQPAAHAELLTVGAVPGEYRWRHEELRQAVLTCAGTDKLGRLRLAAGRALRPNPERLFEAAAQLNALIEWLPAAEGYALAELNLAAGRRAGRLGTAAAAREYFAMGLDLLGADPWQPRPDLALRLHLASADAEQAAGHVERAERLLERAAGRVIDDTDRARILGLQGVLRYGRADPTGALRTVTEALRLLGQPVPTDPAHWQAAAAAEVTRLRPRLDPAGLDRIAVAPECTDPRVVAAADLIADLLRSPRPAQQPARAGADLLAAAGVAMAAAEGPTAATGLILTRLAEVLSTTGDEATAHRCARTGVRLLDLPGARHPAATRAVAALVGPLWLESPERMTRELYTAHRSAAEEGEVALAQRIGILYTVHRFAIGVPLDEIAADLDTRWRYAGRHGMDEPTAAVTRLLDDVVSRLRGLPPAEPDGFTGPDRCTGQPVTAEPERSALPATAEPDRFASVGLMPMLIAAHLLGEAGEQVVRLDLADLTGVPVLTDFLTAEITFLRALALTRRYETAAPSDRPALRAALRTLEGQLDRLAAAGSDLFRARTLLLAAERARIANDQPADAPYPRSQYGRAIGAARDSGCLYLEGLAAELGGRHALAGGDRGEAIAYLRRARSCYQRWGAAAKLNQLDDLLVTSSPTPVGPYPSDQLDLLTVVRAFQVISSELRLDRLVESLLDLLIRHSQADRGYLLIADGPGLRPAAEATVERDRIRINAHVGWRLHDRVPVRLCEHAGQAGTVLTGGPDELTAFAADPYLATHKPRSVLCAPITRRGRLLAVLYLENRLLPAAFTPAYLDLVEILRPQAALALENAVRVSPA